MGPGAKYPTARMGGSDLASGPLRAAAMLFVGQRSLSAQILHIFKTGTRHFDWSDAPISAACHSRSTYLFRSLIQRSV